MKARDAEGLAVGVDAGGTWVRVVAMRGGRVVARAKVANEGVLARTLKRVWREKRLGTVELMVVASRGVWTQTERRERSQELRGLARQVIALSDVEAAYCGALGLEQDGLNPSQGILVLAGTGSIVLGLGRDAEFVREGGRGPLLGDEGSGFWIGREWLRGGGSQRARSLFRGPLAVARIAALARGVISRARKGASEERRIVRDAQSHLAEQAVTVAKAIRLRAPRVSWAGGLMEDPWFRRGVARALARRGVKGTWSEPSEVPVLAAARLAASWISKEGVPRG